MLKSNYTGFHYHYPNLTFVLSGHKVSIITSNGICCRNVFYYPFSNDIPCKFSTKTNSGQNISFATQKGCMAAL